jgi:hypothetical protein
MMLVNESRQSYAQHIELKEAALTACKNEFHVLTKQVEEASAAKVGGRIGIVINFYLGGGEACEMCCARQLLNLPLLLYSSHTKIPNLHTYLCMFLLLYENK